MYLYICVGREAEEARMYPREPYRTADDAMRGGGVCVGDLIFAKQPGLRTRRRSAEY